MKSFYTGIDIGTYHVKVVIAAPGATPDLPMQIIGSGSAASKGMRHGYIIDMPEATRSIKEALQRAQGAAKVNVKSARIAVGGVGLDETRSNGTVTLTAAGGVVTPALMDRALKESEKQASTRLVNRSIIHTIPLEYRIDGSKVLGQPSGLQGTKLSVDTLIISMLSQHHDDLAEAIEAAGVEVEDMMAAPLAASLVTLTKSQKTAGVVLANIGAETLSVIVFDDNTPVSLKVFPVGSADITNSLALTFQLPLQEAEQLKRGAVIGSDIPAKKMDAIINARLKDMFSLVDAHLKSIGRNRLLPAGIVITGGGSGLHSAIDIAKGVLKLPAQTSQVGSGNRASGIDPSWAVAYGLCRWAFAEDAGGSGASFGEVIGAGWDSVKRGLRALLP